MPVYHPPIPSWLNGLDGRIKSLGTRLPPALLTVLRKDFSWFALNYLRDPSVDENARRAFIFWFVGEVTPTEMSSPPPPELPALAYKDLMKIKDEENEEWEWEDEGWEAK